MQRTKAFGRQAKIRKVFQLWYRDRPQKTVFFA